MSLGELLRVKSSEYELLAEWHGERASLDDDHLVACRAMLAVGIALREVAEASARSGGRRADRTEARHFPDRRALRLPILAVFAMFA
jgi:hypothetical protein